MKVPPKRKGNDIHIVFDENMKASMKVPPKRKGNTIPAPVHIIHYPGPQ